MKINLKEDAQCTETEVTICCRKADGDILDLLAALRAFDRKITGEQGGQTFLLDAGDILYADCADKHTFLYTSAGVYETPLRLYELEDRLAGSDFFRASKSLVVNFNQIRSLRPEFGARMVLTMKNGEKCLVSRQYVPILKARLGL